MRNFARMGIVRDYDNQIPFIYATWVIYALANVKEGRKEMQETYGRPNGFDVNFELLLYIQKAHSFNATRHCPGE